jgi:transcriptional regulator with XRE-family HTH domain
MQLNIPKIEKELKRQNLSFSDLAQRLGTTRQWVYWKLNNGQSGTTFRTVEKFAKALDIEPKDLIK